MWSLWEPGSISGQEHHSGGKQHECTREIVFESAGQGGCILSRIGCTCRALLLIVGETESKVGAKDRFLGCRWGKRVGRFGQVATG